MIDNESRLQVHADENGPQGESVYSSGYGSNGASEVTLSSTNEDECSLRSCSVSTEETPDHPVAQPLPQPPIASAYEANQEEFEKNLTVVSTECGVVRRSKASVDKLTALKAHRSSCPTALTVNESLNLNNSYGSAHSSSSNVSIERLTATDDEVVISLSVFLLVRLLKFNSILRLGNSFRGPSRNEQTLQAFT